MLQSYFAIWFYHIFFVLSNVLHHFNAFLVFHCLSGMTHTQLPIADTVLRGLSPATIINKAAGNTSAIVLFGCSVMSNSLRPQLQHARLPCPSLSPRVCLNSRALSQWCHPTISSSVNLFLPLQSFPASGSFPMSQLFTIRWPKYWSFSFRISLSNEYSGLISFRSDWFDLLTVQGTFRSLL